MPRNAVIPIRVTSEERSLLKEAARAVNVSLSEFIRRLALKKRMPPVGVGKVNRETYSELCRIGNNLNQLVRAVNEGRALGVDLNLLAGLRTCIKEIGFQTLGVQDDREAK